MSYSPRHPQGRAVPRTKQWHYQRNGLVSGTLAALCLMLLCYDVFLPDDLTLRLGHFGRSDVTVCVSRSSLNLVATRGLQVSVDDALARRRPVTTGRLVYPPAEPVRQFDFYVFGYVQFAYPGGDRFAVAFVSLWLVLLVLGGYSAACFRRFRPRKY